MLESAIVSHLIDQMQSTDGSPNFPHSYWLNRAAFEIARQLAIFNDVAIISAHPETQEPSSQNPPNQNDTSAVCMECVARDKILEEVKLAFELCMRAADGLARNSQVRAAIEPLLLKLAALPASTDPAPNREANEKGSL